MFFGRFSAGRLLDSSRLLQTAKGRALLEDFGAGDFRPRFDAAVRSLNATLSAVTHNDSRRVLLETTEAELVNLLMNRLGLRDWQKKNPERCAAPLRCTTLVVGRSGEGAQKLAEQVSSESAERTPLARQMNRLAPAVNPVVVPGAAVGRDGHAVPLERLAACDFPAVLWRLSGSEHNASRVDVDLWKWPLIALRSLGDDHDDTAWVLWSALTVAEDNDLIARLGHPKVVVSEPSSGAACGPGRTNHTGVRLATSTRPPLA